MEDTKEQQKKGESNVQDIAQALYFPDWTSETGMVSRKCTGCEILREEFVS